MQIMLVLKHMVNLHKNVFNDEKSIRAFEPGDLEVSISGTSSNTGIMSHDEFVLGYENGSVGCSVSVSQTLRLFFAGKIPERMLSVKLFFWSLGFVLLIAACIIALRSLPVVWALVGGAALMAFYVSALLYGVGDLVLSAALANKDFYEFSKARRALVYFNLQQSSGGKD